MDISIQDKDLYLFGGFIVDPLKRLLLHDGVPISLSPKVFDTLLFLIEHADRLLDKDEMLEGIWPGRVVEENNLSHNISLLRKVLSGTDNQERCIVTAPGQGYRFTASLQRVRVSLIPAGGFRPPLIRFLPTTTRRQLPLRRIVVALRQPSRDHADRKETDTSAA